MRKLALTRAAIAVAASIAAMTMFAGCVSQAVKGEPGKTVEAAVVSADDNVVTVKTGFQSANGRTPYTGNSPEGATAPTTCFVEDGSDPVTINVRDVELSMYGSPATIDDYIRAEEFLEDSIVHITYGADGMPEKLSF